MAGDAMASLAGIFGKDKGAKPAPESDPMPDEAETPAETSSEEKPNAAFTTAIGEAFPDMAGDDDRMASLWRAVKACAEGY